MSRRNAAFAVLALLWLAGTQPAASEESGWMSPPEGSAQGSGLAGTLKCESRNDGRKHCAVDNIDTQSVSLKRKLSQSRCQRGSSWGVDRNGIWVDEGCRAEFSYRRKAGGDSGGGGASQSAMREACIKRAARDWAVTTSNLEITHAERQQNGGYRFNIQSKRTAGTCMVDRGGNVYRLDTR